MDYNIDPKRLERFLSEEAHLRRGAGRGANGTIDVCFIQSANWLAGGDGKSDDHPCIDSGIRRFGIRLNDAERFSEWRDELKPFALRVLGTNVGLEITKIRRFMCADWAIRIIAPMAFDYWADNSPKRADEARIWAAKLRAVNPIADEASAKAGRAAVREARAAASAAASAYASAYASAAASAYAYAAAYAYASAYASAAARSKADTFSRSMWDESLRFLDRLIRVTEV